MSRQTYDEMSPEPEVPFVAPHLRKDSRLAGAVAVSHSGARKSIRKIGILSGSAVPGRSKTGNVGTRWSA